MKNSTKLFRSRSILIGLIFLGISAKDPLVAAEQQKQPNIIFFFIDDMGWKDWNGNGNPKVDTPSINRIADEGVVFNQGYVNAANCAPSRCCVLSGQYTPRTHFYNVWSIDRGNENTDRLSLDDVEDGQVFSEEKISFAEALKKAGYATAMYGKWHVSGHSKAGSGNEGGVSAQMQGFDDVLEHSAGKLKALYSTTKDPKHINTYTDRAIRFAEKNVKENKPFMIYLAHHAVHGPIEYSQESFEHIANRSGADKNPLQGYASMMYDTDKSIGRVLDKLEELKIRNNTVIIFLSDNGGVPGVGGGSQAPLRCFKGSYYEGGIRVPFIISWPEHFKPSKTETPVMAIDLYPTMLELAGVKDIDKHLGDYPIDGKSILSLLNGGSMKERAIFWHFPGYLVGNPKYTETRVPEYRQLPVSVIRKGDWKLLLHLEEWSLDGGLDTIDTNNAIELYNLKEDIGEKNNLALTNVEKRNAMLRELLTWHQNVNAEIPKEPNPLLGKGDPKKKKDPNK